MTDKPKSSGKIVRSFVCEKCGMEMKSNEEYKQHRIDHTLGKPMPEVDPVSGEVKPDPNQPEQASVQPVVPPKPHTTASWPSKSEPITLKYIFTGTCPNCSTPVETIPLDVDVEKQKKHVVICWCPQCHKNIQQRNVVKL